MADATGNPVSIGYTINLGGGLNAESVTDSQGVMTEMVRDSKGNVVRTIKHFLNDENVYCFQIDISEYDSKGNLLGSAQTFTVARADVQAAGKDQFNYVPDDLRWDSRGTFDDRGNQLTYTDAWGQTTYYTYDPRGNLLKTIDPFGQVTENRYDGSGRLTEVVDAAGNRTAYGYDSQGNPTHITRTLADGTSQELASVEYDAKGRVNRMVDLSGNVTIFAYDARGNQTLSEQHITDGGVTHIVKTHTVYDAEGRVLATFNDQKDGDGEFIMKSVSMSKYDSAGLVLASVSVSGVAAAALQPDATFEQCSTKGLVSEYEYDIRGQQIESRSQVMDEDGSLKWFVSRTVYDSAGRAIWQTESFLEHTSHVGVRATHMVYDSLGRVIKTENWSGVEIAVETVNGFKTTVARPSGTLNSYTEQAYDDAGRTLWTRALTRFGEDGEPILGPVTLYFYTPEGALDYTTLDVDGDLATNDRITLGRTVYDEYGRQVAGIVDRDGDLSTTDDQVQTRYIYDDFGRVVQTIFADGTAVKTGYNVLGQKVSETDQLGNITRFEYDSMGRLSAVILPKIKLNAAAATLYGLDENTEVSVRYEYEYDARGNQTLIRDNIYQLADGTIHREKARETHFEYDWQGRQISRTMPLGQKESFVYNDDGQLVSHTDLDDRTTTFTYDDRLGANGRLKSKTFHDGTTESYSYDIWGRVWRVENGAVITETNYTHDGQVESVTTQIGDKPLNTIHYEYDEITGQLLRTYTTVGKAGEVYTDTRYTYDRLGRLETVTATKREGQAVEEITKYVYDILGNLDKIKLSNGVTTDYDYDLLNRLVNLKHTNAIGETLLNTAYELLANGFKWRELTTDADGTKHDYLWTYDAMGRLTSEWYDKSVGSADDFESKYLYDLVGNRLEKITDKGIDGTIDERVKSEFDRNDRILSESKFLGNSTEASETTTYQWGQRGTLTGTDGVERETWLGTDQTGKETLNGETHTRTEMKYNAQGRLCEIIITTSNSQAVTSRVTQQYTYDANGIKIRQTEIADTNGDGVTDSAKDTTYLVDALNHTGYAQVLEETEHDAEGNVVKVITYTIGHDVISQFSVAMEALLAGTGTLAFLYDGHGSNRAVVDASGQILQRYNYDAYGNAAEFNPSKTLTNLLYSGEQFNPTSGLQYLRARWYNPQAGRFNRVDPFAGNMNDPQSLHKYAYVHNNPVMGIDPSGELLAALLLVTISFMVTLAIDLITVVAVNSREIPFINSLVKMLEKLSANTTIEPIAMAEISNKITCLIAGSLGRIAKNTINTLYDPLSIGMLGLAATIGSLGHAGRFLRNGVPYTSGQVKAMTFTKDAPNFSCQSVAKNIMNGLKGTDADRFFIQIRWKSQGVVEMPTSSGKQVISTNGLHEGVWVDGLIFDNHFRGGVSFHDWLNSFTSSGKHFDDFDLIFPGEPTLKILGYQ